MTFAAVVVAAGRGTRFGRPKQLVDIAGKPMLWWSLHTFAQMDEVPYIVVVTEREWLEEVGEVAFDAAGKKLIGPVGGGPTRQSSTLSGLQTVPEGVDGVFVHDGARPLVRAEEVRRGMQFVRPGHGSLLAVPVVDTIKIVGRDDIVEQTLDRSVLWAAQTPQFATYSDMRMAHEAARQQDIEATDDAMLLERWGVKVHVVRGSPENFKVTLAEDRARAEHAIALRHGQGDKV